MAERVAARLRAQHFRVDASSLATASVTTVKEDPTARYDVFVPDPASADAVPALKALSLSTEPAAGGLVVTPTMALRDAVALARTLTSQGLRVQVRRTAAPRSESAIADGPFHRVRVGAFADRAAAADASRILEERGYRPFITRDAR
jgi:hypothetical protein